MRMVSKVMVTVSKCHGLSWNMPTCLYNYERIQIAFSHFWQNKIMIFSGLQFCTKAHLMAFMLPNDHTFPEFANQRWLKHSCVQVWGERLRICNFLCTEIDLRGKIWGLYFGHGSKSAFSLCAWNFAKTFTYFMNVQMTCLKVWFQRPRKAIVAAVSSMEISKALGIIPRSKLEEW